MAIRKAKKHIGKPIWRRYIASHAGGYNYHFRIRVADNQYTLAMVAKIGKLWSVALFGVYSLARDAVTGEQYKTAMLAKRAAEVELLKVASQIVRIG